MKYHYKVENNKENENENEGITYKKQLRDGSIEIYGRDRKQTNLDSGKEFHSQYCGVSPHVMSKSLAPSIQHFLPLNLSNEKLCNRSSTKEHELNGMEYVCMYADSFTY